MSRRGNREGTICKRRDGRWCGALFLGYDSTGKPVRKYVYGKTRQEVSEKLMKLLPQAISGTAPERYTVASWIHFWLDTYKRNEVRESTLERYQIFFQKHILPAFGKILLHQLRPEQLQRFYVEKQKELSQNTVRFLHAIIHGALKQALALGYISRNVADIAKPPKRAQKEVKIMDAEKLDAFLSSARKYRLYPAFLLMASTGMRTGEVLGLRWQDVDFEQGTVTIAQNLVWTEKGIIFQEPKTKSSRRSIPLLPEVVEELKSWRKKWLEEKIALGSDWSETDLVFPSEVHTPLDPHSFRRTFRSICADAGIKGITPHVFRHSLASFLLARGEHPKIVQELLGHSSITVTLDIYSKVIPGLKEKAVQKIRDFLPHS
jgi:integrase